MTLNLQKLPVLYNCELSILQKEEIEAYVSNFQTLGDVMAWGLNFTPPRLVSEVIHQDEYTLDVLVPWSHECVLVYDAT